MAPNTGGISDRNIHLGQNRWNLWLGGHFMISMGGRLVTDNSY